MHQQRPFEHQTIYVSNKPSCWTIQNDGFCSLVMLSMSASVSMSKTLETSYSAGSIEISGQAARLLRRFQDHVSMTSLTMAQTIIESLESLNSGCNQQLRLCRIVRGCKSGEDASAEHAKTKQIWRCFHHSWDRRKRTKELHGTWYVITCSTEKTMSTFQWTRRGISANWCTWIFQGRICEDDVGYVSSQQINHRILQCHECVTRKWTQCWCLLKWPIAQKIPGYGVWFWRSITADWTW